MDLKTKDYIIYCAEKEFEGNSVVIETARTIQELLHKLRDSDTEMHWHVVMDDLNSKKEYRHDRSKKFMIIHPLLGYVDDVCDIRNEPSYDSEWCLSYVSELWYGSVDGTMKRVLDFNDYMICEVHEYMEKHGLHFES